MDLMYYSLWFIVGFIVGGFVVYVLVFKLSSKVKLQDELTRSKRELANAKRALDEYFSTSADLFAQLDRSYQQYARYMGSSANKLSDMGHELFEVHQPIRFKKPEHRGPGAGDSEDQPTVVIREIKPTDTAALPDNSNNDKKERTERTDDDSGDDIINDVRVIDSYEEGNSKKDTKEPSELKI